MAIGGLNSDWRTGTQPAPTVLTDFTGKVRTASLDSENEEIDATVWGNNGYRRFEASFTNAMIEVEYWFDKVLWMQLMAIHNSRAYHDWRLSPDGIATDDPYCEGEGLLIKVGTPISVGEGIVLPGTWRVNGPITFDLFA